MLLIHTYEYPKSYNRDYKCTHYSSTMYVVHEACISCVCKLSIQGFKDSIVGHSLIRLEKE